MKQNELKWFLYFLYAFIRLNYKIIWEAFFKKKLSDKNWGKILR